MHKHRLCFTLRTKNPNTSPIGKKFGFCCCGAPPGTRTLGPLIKRANRRFVSIYGSFELSLFLIKSTWFFTQQFLHPLSDFAAKSTLCTFWNRAKSVQKPCTYSLTNKNHTIHHRLDGNGLSDRPRYPKLSLYVYKTSVILSFYYVRTQMKGPINVLLKKGDYYYVTQKWKYWQHMICSPYCRYIT